MLEGGIIAYESNIRTGGAGAEYFGIGASGQYQVEDQVTRQPACHRTRFGRTARPMSLPPRPSIPSNLRAGVYRFIDFKRLLEAEAGITNNEPVDMVVMSAIESSVIHLIARQRLPTCGKPPAGTDIQGTILGEYLDAPTPML